MKQYMGQVMAECDCTHPACDQRGYCMADHIEALEAKLDAALERGFWAGRSCGGSKADIDATLAELKGKKDE